MIRFKLFFLVFFFIFGINANSQSWLTFTKEELGYSGPIEDLKLDESDGSVWMSTDDKLVHIKIDGTHETYSYSTLSDGLDVVNVRAIHVADTGIICLDALEGILYVTFEPSANLTVVDNSILSGQYIYEDNFDTLWLGTKSYYDEGFFSFYDGEIIEEFSVSNCDLTVNTIYSIQKDQLNRMWLTHWNDGEGSGITLVDGAIWQRMHHGNSALPTPLIPNIVISDVGQVVACTEMGGLCVFDEDLNDWNVYNMENSNMPSDHVTNGVFDSDGRFWAIFSGTALGYTENFIDWTIFNSENSPLTFIANSDFIIIDEFDNIWFGGYNRIHAMNLETFGGWMGEQEASTTPVGINVYPNPSTGLVNIQSTSELAKIIVYDLLGKEITVFEEITSQIDLSKLERGTYIIKSIAQSGENSISRVVLN